MELTIDSVLKHYNDHDVFEEYLANKANEFYQKEYYPFFENLIKKLSDKYGIHVNRYTISHYHALTKCVYFSGIFNTDSQNSEIEFTEKDSDGDIDYHNVPLWYIFDTDNKWKGHLEVKIEKILIDRGIKAKESKQAEAKAELARLEKRMEELKKII